jgi:thiol-disulfide isomerase/thioredoxin
MSNLLDFSIVGCIYVIAALGINILVPILSKNRIVKYLRQELNSLKANEDVFEVFLKKQAHYAVNKSDSQILFGNPDAGLRITVLTNPFCNPCALMHKRIERLLKDTNDKICIQYIFASFASDLDFANKYLIAAYMEHDRSSLPTILVNGYQLPENYKIEDLRYFVSCHCGLDPQSHESR